MTGYIPIHEPAVRRDPMPPRICGGFERECTTQLSIYNPEALCSCCTSRRADAIAEKRHTVSSTLPTHCRHGHAYTFANTYQSAKSGRQCRTCARLRDRSGRGEAW